MRDRVRWTARFVLGLLIIGSLASAGWNGWQILHNPLVRVTAERGVEEIRARLDTALLRSATPEKMAAHLSDLLDDTPRDWARIDAVADLAEVQGTVLPPSVATELKAARNVDHSALGLAKGCAGCLWDVSACSLSAVLICRAPIDVTPLGDLASILLQVTHMARSEPVDEIDLLLSTIGFGAVVLAPVVGGSSLSLKLGAGTAKLAYRMGSLTPPLIAEGRRLAAQAIDWNRIRASRPGRFLDDLPRAVRKGAMEPVVAFVRHVDDMRQVLGPRWTLFVLRKVDSEQDARRMVAVARAAERKTPGALEMLGKNRLLRLAVRWSDEVYAIVHAVASALLAAAMLLLSILKGRLLASLRRAARAPRA